MADKYYDSPLTGEELDKAFRNIAELDSARDTAVQSAAAASESAAAAAESQTAAAQSQTEAAASAEQARQYAESIDPSRFATAEQGEKAETAVQRVNGKTPSEDGTVKLSPSDIGAIQSVNDRQGTTITLTPSDIGAATSAQGVKADNALPASFTQISTLTEASQLPKKNMSFVHFDCGSDINAHVTGGKTFTDYSTGDFYGLFLGASDLNYGTFIITTPRWDNGFWVAQIWQGQFTRFTNFRNS